MNDNYYINKYGVKVQFEFNNNTKDDNQDISTIIANAFAKFVSKELNIF